MKFKHKWLRLETVRRGYATQEYCAYCGATKFVGDYSRSAEKCKFPRDVV